MQYQTKREQKIVDNIYDILLSDNALLNTEVLFFTLIDHADLSPEMACKIALKIHHGGNTINSAQMKALLLDRNIELQSRQIVNLCKKYVNSSRVEVFADRIPIAYRMNGFSTFEPPFIACSDISDKSKQYWQHFEQERIKKQNEKKLKIEQERQNILEKIEQVQYEQKRKNAAEEIPKRYAKREWYQRIINQYKIEIDKYYHTTKVYKEIKQKYNKIIELNNENEKAIKELEYLHDNPQKI